MPGSPTRSPVCPPPRIATSYPCCRWHSLRSTSRCGGRAITEYRHSRWFEGRGTGDAESPGGFVHTSLSARYAKRRLRWSVEWHGVCAGLFGPSMGLTLPRCALQGQPSAVQIRSGRICRTREGSSTPLSPPDTQNAPEGRRSEEHTSELQSPLNL